MPSLRWIRSSDSCVDCGSRPEVGSSRTATRHSREQFGDAQPLAHAAPVGGYRAIGSFDQPHGCETASARITSISNRTGRSGSMQGVLVFLPSSDLAIEQGSIDSTPQRGRKSRQS